MALIKDIYHLSFYERLANSLGKVLPNFNSKKFVKAVMPNNFVAMEWKQRMQHTTDTLHQFMPTNFEAGAPMLASIITQLKADGFGEHKLEFMFLPAYISSYGLNHLNESIKALEIATQYISAEFAVRPFLIKYHDEMMVQMLKWSTHENYHVRRFASEGSRPRLPWGLAIGALKINPNAILPIVENLKNDPSEYVRRSVANNLNDITKDNPEVVIELAQKWKGIGKETDAIIKHACRSLLKAGHPEILSFYGLDAKRLTLSNPIIENPEVKVGEALAFSFNIENEDSVARYIRLEYAIYYLKSNGQQNAKVFKINERTYQPKEKCLVSRKQSFKPITTRKFYPGEHRIGFLVNGKELANVKFILKE
ncbi:MAG: DNA alkylation repair protein [Chitinophagaceae bacterium]|nr:MAG: DNA alkylation repair protein [Chitinophagaceae bacterium]